MLCQCELSKNCLVLLCVFKQGSIFLHAHNAHKAHLQYKTFLGSYLCVQTHKGKTHKTCESSWYVDTIYDHVF